MENSSALFVAIAASAVQTFKLDRLHIATAADCWMWRSFFLATFLVAQLWLGHGKGVKDDPPMVVLITGCSTGIGKSIALEFSNRPGKYHIWATMRSTASWDVPEIPNLNIIEMDVTSDESVTVAVNRIIEKEGRIDVLINNAGYGIVGTVESVDISDGKVKLSI